MSKLQIISVQEPSLKGCYASLSFGGGFALRDYTAVLNQNAEQSRTLNPWFFITLFRLLQDTPAFNDLSFDVQPSSATISIDGDETLVESKLASLLMQLSELKVSEESLTIAKEASYLATKKSLDRVRNQPIWKILEFTNINKGFTLSKFLASHNDLNEQIFNESLSLLISSANAYLFIATPYNDGIAEYLQNQNLSQWEKMEKITWNGRLLDPYLLSDVHVRTRGKKRSKLSALNICFGSRKLNPTQQLLLTDIYASALPDVSAEVESDPFDCSIVVSSTRELTLREQLKLANESQFEEAKQKTINKYLAMILFDPRDFVNLCAERGLWGIHIFDYMEALSKLTFSLFQEFVEDGDAILREGAVISEEEVRV